jgi:SAM-dependent methyltransferase
LANSPGNRGRSGHPGGTEPTLSATSLRWLAGTDPKTRKSRGQYLTPQPVAEALVDRVDLEPGMRVLDPGVGTGELLAAVARRCPGVDLTGWDIDPTALLAARELIWSCARPSIRPPPGPPTTSTW